MKWFPYPARRLALTVVLLASLAASACGKKEGKVSGVVTYQGKPLPAGSVVFVGDDKSLVQTPIKNDGSYQLTNVPLGDVKIAVTTPSPPPTDLPPDVPKPPADSTSSVAIPQKYMNAETSGLSYTVTGGSQTHPIDLK